jgi:hypothetical protein
MLDVVEGAVEVYGEGFVGSTTRLTNLEQHILRIWYELQSPYLANVNKT